MNNKVILKSADTVISEETLKGLIGKLVNVPTNEHEMVKQLTNTKEKVNVWFAGTVAGFEKQTIGYDFVNDSFHEPIVMYSLLLTDGHAYILSPSCVIEELSEEDFLKMIEEQEKAQAVKDALILPGKDF